MTHAKQIVDDVQVKHGDMQFRQLNVEISAYVFYGHFVKQ